MAGNEIVIDFRMAAATFANHLSTYSRKIVPSLDDAIRSTMTQVGQEMDATAPVDTGALKANRSPVTQSGPLTYGTGYDLEYAPVLEYGGYRRVGKKTIALGGGDLGEGFIAGAGIYSKQSPLGWVRKALVKEKLGIGNRIGKILQANWT